MNLRSWKRERRNRVERSEGHKEGGEQGSANVRDDKNYQNCERKLRMSIEMRYFWFYLFLYRFTVLSCDTVAKNIPSGLHLIETTYFTWSLNVTTLGAELEGEERFICVVWYRKYSSVKDVISCAQWFICFVFRYLAWWAGWVICIKCGRGPFYSM